MVAHRTGCRRCQVHLAARAANDAGEVRCLRTGQGDAVATDVEDFNVVELCRQARQVERGAELHRINTAGGICRFIDGTRRDTDDVEVVTGTARQRVAEG